MLKASRWVAHPLYGTTKVTTSGRIASASDGILTQRDCPQFHELFTDYFYTFWYSCFQKLKTRLKSTSALWILQKNYFWIIFFLCMCSFKISALKFVKLFKIIICGISKLKNTTSPPSGNSRNTQKPLLPQQFLKLASPFIKLEELMMPPLLLGYCFHF